MVWMLCFVIALLLVAVVVLFIVKYSDVKVELSLPPGIRLTLNGKK